MQLKLGRKFTAGRHSIEPAVNIFNVFNTGANTQWMPAGALRARVRKVKRDTEAMLGNASPRKPIVLMALRSSAR